MLRNSSKPDQRRTVGQRRYRTVSRAAGEALLTRITIETVLPGFFSPHQPVMMVLGVLIIVLTLLPGVRDRFRKDTVL